MPSSALYWHIGAMTTRLRSSRFLILKGSNNVDIMCSSFNVNFIVTETGPNIKDKGSVRNKKPLRYGGRGKSSSIFFERDDPFFNCISDVPEHLMHFLVRSGRFCRVFKSPVHALNMRWCHRTIIICISAERDDVIRSVKQFFINDARFLIGDIHPG